MISCQKFDCRAVIALSNHRPDEETCRTALPLDSRSMSRTTVAISPHRASTAADRKTACHLPGAASGCTNRSLSRRLEPIGIVENDRRKRAGRASQIVSGAGEDKFDVAELRESRGRCQRGETRRQDAVGLDRDAKPRQRRRIETAEAAAGAHNAPASSGAFERL